MTDPTSKSLYDLYVRAGESLVARQQKKKAADAFALGLYYATELGNPQAQKFCRQRIVHCDSGHPAASLPPPPLVFAQLLMNFTAEMAEATIVEPVASKAPAKAASLSSESLDVAKWRSMGLYVIEDDSLASPAPQLPEPQFVAVTPSANQPWLMAGGIEAAPESNPMDVEPFLGALTSTKDSQPSPSNPSFLADAGQTALDGGSRSLFDFELPSDETAPPPTKAKPAKASPTPTVPRSPFTLRGSDESVDADSMDSHHVFDLGSDLVAGLRTDSIRSIEDLLVAAPLGKSEPVVERQSSPVAGLLNVAAGLVAAVGFAAVGFFGYALYPELKRLDFSQFVETMTGGEGGSSAVTSESLPPLIVHDDEATNSETTTVKSTPAARSDDFWGQERQAVYVAPATPTKK